MSDHHEAQAFSALSSAIDTVVVAILHIHTVRNDLNRLELVKTASKSIEAAVREYLQSESDIRALQRGDD